MIAQELLDLVRRKPFVPFRIHFTEGETYDVTHPDGVMVTAMTTAIAVRRSPDEDFPYKTQSYREELIAALDRAGVEYDPKYLE